MPLDPWQILRKVKVLSPNDEASHPRRLKSSIILFTVTSKLAQRHTQPTIQCVLLGLSWWSQMQRDGDLSPPSGDKAKNEWSYTQLSSTCLHGTDTDNSAFNCAFFCYNVGFRVLEEQTVFIHLQSSSVPSSWQAAQFSHTFPDAAVTTGQVLNWPELISLHYTLQAERSLTSQMNKPTNILPHTLTRHSEFTLT
jgi:hypothetical protein